MIIDLHTHTTASDGKCAPADLVARAAAGGVGVLAVTDHDTVAGCAAASAACAAAGIEFVAGIEMTAVLDEADVHILGYFFDLHSPALAEFLAVQRRRRLDRVRQMIGLLRPFGIDLDADAIVRPALDDGSRSVGRPWIARALVAAGHVASIGEAFDVWLSRGRPAFVPRFGAGPGEVVDRIHHAGGIASIAHPGLLGRDDRIPAFVAAGLDAVEAYHSDHDAVLTARYLDLADRLGVPVSGGSDYHGDQWHGDGGPGSVRLPHDRFDVLVARHHARQESVS